VIALIILIISLSIFGTIIEKTSIGDKKLITSSMVESVEADDFNQVSVESRKVRWATIVYSFSFTKNF